MFWNYQYEYKNAITNELGLSCQCKLYLLTNKKNETYRNRCEQVHTWLLETVDMINSSLWLFNDGLNDSTCLNNDGLTWTYNQGVILLGLELMSQIDPARYFNASLTLAKRLIYGVTTHLIQIQNTSSSVTPQAHILREVVNATQVRTSTDHEQFKGIWMRYASYFFKYLQDLNIEPQLRNDMRNFVRENWYYGLLTYAKYPSDGVFVFDSVWYEDYQYSDGVSQTSAIDAFNAAFVFL
ncbi:hypothetical protein RFI_12624 [Reticulomyxa filosa]|uniref:Uncharacterized protein n=1 Tax=Reticulomyxa filosa TaxID=46433 RepID=X6NF48_RETFI|nr:hypothetical protein RFI_12624 [Reticulomyxa filosa]|eukprot:ETO24533.1 hypothetical protein RFI_12624 [Reticulomyxa filosa]